MPPPELPTELIVTIAEFLAGSFAYRSLAQLNLASQAIHEETLPVLFETVVWDTDRKWWIHDGGHVPRGWEYTRYLVTMDHLSKSILRYFSSLADDDDPNDQHVARIFPRLVMIIKKTIDREFTAATPIVNLHMTLYKPISPSTFLLASTTRVYRCKTTFFGAEVQPAFCPDVDGSYRWGEEVVMEERIARVSLEADGEIAGDAVEPREGWYGQSGGRRDFVFQLDQDYDTIWGLPEMRQTLRGLFGLIPPRRSGDLEPYPIDVKGFDVDCLEVFSDVLPDTLCGHVSFTVPVFPVPDPFPGCDNLSKLTKHLTAISSNYAKEWHRLGMIGPGEVFFQTYYEDLRLEGDPDDGGDAEEYVVVGTLTSLDPDPFLDNVEDDNAENMSEPRRGEKWDGFELVIQRRFYDDWMEWGVHAPVQEDVLFRQTYRPVTASDSAFNHVAEGGDF